MTSEISPENYCRYHFWNIYDSIHREAVLGKSTVIDHVPEWYIKHSPEKIIKMSYDNTDKPTRAGGKVFVRSYVFKNHDYSPAQLVSLIMNDINDSARKRNKNYFVKCKKNFGGYEFTIHQQIKKGRVHIMLRLRLCLLRLCGPRQLNNVIYVPVSQRQRKRT